MSQSGFGDFGQPQEEVREEDMLQSNFKMLHCLIFITFTNKDPLNPDNDPNRRGVSGCVLSYPLQNLWCDGGSMT